MTAARRPSRPPAAPARPSRPARGARGSRPLRPALLALAATVVVVLLGAFVFPTRTYLAQRAAISETSHELEVLREQQADLDAQAERLRDDAEIERRAREQHNLVRPGEEAYALLPGQGSASTRPPAPAGEDRHADRGLLGRAWDAVAGLF